MNDQRLVGIPITITSYIVFLFPPTVVAIRYLKLFFKKLQHQKPPADSAGH